MKLRQNLNWMLEKYTQEYEQLQAEIKGQRVGRNFLTGRMIAIKGFIEDLQEMLEEGEDE